MDNLEDEYEPMIEINSIDDAKEWLRDNREFLFVFNEVWYIMQTSEAEENGMHRHWYYFGKVKKGREVDIVCDDYSMGKLWHKPVFDGKNFIEIFPKLKFYF